MESVEIASSLSLGVISTLAAPARKCPATGVRTVIPGTLTCEASIGLTIEPKKLWPQRMFPIRIVKGSNRPHRAFFRTPKGTKKLLLASEFCYKPGGYEQHRCIPLTPRLDASLPSPKCVDSLRPCGEITTDLAV